jgi:hypothetical protein
MNHDDVIGSVFIFAISKKSACNTLHCEAAAHGAPLRRCPLHRAGEEREKKRAWPTIACAAHTNRTWQAAARCQRSKRQIRGSKSNEMHQLLVQTTPAPDALDELRNTMHGVTVVRHDAADAPLHLHQTTVSACEQQQPALARAIVREWHLRSYDALKFRCMHLSRRVTNTRPPAPCAPPSPCGN